MIRATRKLLALVAVAATTLAGIGTPVHGHAAHADHEAPHVEVGHHDHDAAYEQGDLRLLVRGVRLAPVSPAIEPLSPAGAFTAPAEPPRAERPAGRDPPVPSSPRAPPA